VPSNAFLFPPRLPPIFPAVLLAGLTVANACELCAIYSASDARGETGSGWLLTVSEQFVYSSTLEFEGEPFSDASFLEDSYLYDSMTHIVPTYNFSKTFGVSLNVPIAYRQFNRHEIRYEPFGNTFISRIDNEEGSVFGLGDTALVGRWTPFHRTEMNWSATVNLLAGVKFPTGDTDRLEDEVEQAERALIALGPQHSHTVLPIHQSELSLGSGSFDGIFGLTTYLRYSRWFLNNQIQYYLRTEAEDFQFGHEFIVSGGPGAYALLHDNYTVSLQANVFYEDKGRDEILGRKSDFSGTTITYLGPLIGVTWGDRISAYAGAEFPVDSYNHGLQLLPDYRVRAGITWRF
jgi:hypothetical protein